MEYQAVIMNIKSPSISDILFNQNSITHNQMGIDTITQIANYETVIKMVERIGLTIEPLLKSNKLHKKLIKEVNADTKIRYSSDKWTPTIEVIKLPKVKGRSKALYISIVRNTPTLFDVATHHKKAKDTFCMVLFAGLHQPTKKMESEATKIMSKFLKRKTFKVLPFDVAIDRDDKEPINYKQKESFKAKLMPYSKKGVICPSWNATTLYINKPTHSLHFTRISDYDKFLKQTKHHDQKLDKNLENWKRLEITLKPPIPTSKENKGFIEYIKSIDFLDALYDVDEVAGVAGIKTYKNDYLIYQLNSFIDNRTMNNRESKEQYNSVEALDKFKDSDFIRQELKPIKMIISP